MDFTQSVTGGLYNVTPEVEVEGGDIIAEGKKYMMYKIGDALHKFYFLILVPAGVVGNILSFLVMMQKLNRRMSFSIFLAVLSVADTISLLIGFTRYLNSQLGVFMPPSQYWYCTLTLTTLNFSNLCSTLFILNVTFGRFYSIVRPHKAASFNTVKKAKIIIVCTVAFSAIYNIPHLFTSGQNGRSCIPFGKAMSSVPGQFYVWFSFAFKFVIPFVLLLFMNSVIIHTLRRRSRSNLTMSETQGHGQNQGQTPKLKNSEKQMFTILLLVTFAFLILTIPPYSLFIYINVVDYRATSRLYAGFVLFHSVGQKADYTNYGVNFYLYILSGTKFRSDLRNLFRFQNKPGNSDSVPRSSTSVSTITA